MTWSNIRKLAGAMVLALVMAYGTGAALTGSPTLDVAAAEAQTGGVVPGGSKSASPIPWGQIRAGLCGNVSIPDAKAGCMINSDGDVWRAAKNGPLSQFGGIFLLASIIVIAAFYLIRGKIRIDHGRDPQGRTIERFNALERATHWLTASSFIVLGLTGLNVSYGRYVLKPILGADAFGALTYYGKLAHNYIAFAFILGIVIMFLLWVRHNIPTMRDLKWLAIGGGLFSKGVHPEAPRFNAGQKIIFWLVILGGASLALSGLALMFPGDITPWAGTFAILNVFGGGFPTELSILQETQLSVLWHSLIALVMIGIVIGHIYIGSLGMEGAIDAVGSGQVDLNWAKEHHSLWVEEEMAKGTVGGTQPAE